MTNPNENVLDSSRSDEYRSWLRNMILIRRFEEAAGEAYAIGHVGGFCHLYVGQEAVAVGSIGALTADDVIMCSYREHGHALARGVSARAVMAELYGKVTGCSSGKGGSMHMFDVDKGMLGGHGIVAGQIPLATGAAFAFKYREEKNVAVAYFGEAAVNNGAFHESLNMAALWNLPVVFICENNRYGMGTALERSHAVWNIHERSCSYDMPSQVADGMDVLDMNRVASMAVERAREEGIPTLIEARTYRFMGHSMSDPIHGHYRSREEVEAHKLKDPLITFADQLINAGLLSQEEVKGMETEVAAEVSDAVAFAEESATPEPSALFTDVYAD
jgi:pyruvate dehydrogenase E1 component alpha subunit